MKKQHILKTVCLFACSILAVQSIKAQNENIIKHLELQARGDYQREYIDGKAIRDNSGFKGKYFNFIISGEITEGLSYYYRQRLNRISSSSTFFDATDWLYLNYDATKNLTLSAGKQVVGIGGFEYERAPINIYFASEYWNNIPCYQWGVSATLHTNSQKDHFLLQVCQSPFRTYVLHNDIYAYNLMWTGQHNWFETLWSLNLQEFAEGKFINYITLGNALNFGKWRVELDLMNRAVDKQTFLFRDCSVMGEVRFKASDAVSVFAKATYDVNKSEKTGDYCVLPGTEVTRIGGGVEYFPLKNRNLRLHADYCYTMGTQGNISGALRDKQSCINAGLTWNVNFIDK